jgi:hypothetical protein
MNPLAASLFTGIAVFCGLFATIEAVPDHMELVASRALFALAAAVAAACAVGEALWYVHG